jgi:hypothetical protein
MARNEGMKQDLFTAHFAPCVWSVDPSASTDAFKDPPGMKGDEVEVLIVNEGRPACGLRAAQRYRSHVSS